MRRLLPAALSLFAIGALVGPIQAQAPPLAGAVVAQGKPVAGAKVWLRHSLPNGDGEQTKLIEAESDAQGNFKLAGPADEGARLYELIARAPDGQFGWLNLSRDLNSGPNLRIELMPVGEARGRLADAKGQAIPKAAIQVEMLTLGPDAEFGGRRQLSLPKSLQNFFEPTVNADGTFVIRGIPLGADIYATLAAPDFGDPHIGWNRARASRLPT